MNRMRTAFLMLLLLLGAAAPAALRAQGPAQPDAARPAGETARPAAPATGVAVGGVTVGVVDFVRVLDAYPRAIEEQKKITDWRQQSQAMLQAEEKKLKELQLKRDDIQQGTAERDLKDLELSQKMRELDGRQQVIERELRRRVDQFYALMLDDMERAVAIVASERGVQLVLRVHPGLDPGDSSGMKSRLFESRVVWFAASEIDLTAAVITLLQAPLPPRTDAPTPTPGQPKTDPQTPAAGG